MNDLPYLCLPVAEIPAAPDWLQRQPRPVIALGEGDVINADVVVAGKSDLAPLVTSIERTPITAMTLVQVLRAVEQLPLQEGMTVESLAYATLQGGPEYRSWLERRDEAPRLVTGGEGEPLVIRREDGLVQVELNRPENRNALTVEMRDALMELFELVLADETIEHVQLSGRGNCFSVGGELREFGLTPDAGTAHWIRSLHNPGRMLASCADRVSCHLHSACLGSGIELPAFASHVSAAPRSFFQLPELGFGLIPGAGGCVSISRRIGRQRTAWLALSGKKITAKQALAWGLIDEIRESA